MNELEQLFLSISYQDVLFCSILFSGVGESNYGLRYLGVAFCLTILIINTPKTT